MRDRAFLTRIPSPHKMTKKRGKKAGKNMANPASTSTPAATTSQDPPIELYAHE